MKSWEFLRVKNHESLHTWLHVTEEEKGWPPRESNLCTFIKAEPAGEVHSFTFLQGHRKWDWELSRMDRNRLCVSLPLATPSVCPHPHPKCDTQVLLPLGGMDAETSCLFLLSSFCCVFPWNDSWWSCTQGSSDTQPKSWIIFFPLEDHPLGGFISQNSSWQSPYSTVDVSFRVSLNSQSLLIGSCGMSVCLCRQMNDFFFIAAFKLCISKYSTNIPWDTISSFGNP